MKIIKSLSLSVAAVAGITVVIVVVSAVGSALTNWWVALALASMLIAALLVANLAGRSVPRRTILELDLTQGMIEQTPASPLAKAVAADAYTVRDLVDLLTKAGQDKRVVGLVARVGHKNYGVARAQEVHDAVVSFARSGKTTVAYAETLAEMGSAAALPEMVIAAAFDEFYLQPGAGLGVHGVLARATFFRRALDKLGIVPSFDHRHEYKAAMYQLTEDHMVQPHREATEALRRSHYDQLVSGIAVGRGLDESAVRDAIDRAPLLASEAVDVGFVDDLLYRDQVYDRVEDGWGAKAKTMTGAEYLVRAGRPHRRGPAIALIYATGLVAQGKSRFEPLTRQPSMGSDDVAKAIRMAVENKKVKAIVLRVDSPGGSAVASDVIGRAVDQARKPVIVSMGEVAASGGYWIAATADKIVAQPGTVTGSIGVLSGKLVTKEAWAKVGITFDEVHYGQNATFGSTDQDYTEAERGRLQAQLDSIYEAFVARVAEGRGMDPADVDQIARGRVWTGADAAEHGLVDELGGLVRSYALAAEVAGVDPEKFRVQVFPKPRSALRMLLKRGDQDSTLTSLIQALAPVAEVAAELGTTIGAGVVSTPGFKARL